ncbi:pickpocket protein 28-like isoform X1 [Ostrinia nubilalis]|uniref:pickpocket protein 28-like isoform X1 n=1 Tax=Ostrinia nubilalis TaxID=29057 RepID=UPI0030825DD8
MAQYSQRTQPMHSLGSVEIHNSSIKRRTITIKEVLNDYTKNSNLHGLRYIGEKERTLLEKLFWTFTFIFCVVLCGFQIFKVYTKWDDTPVIVTFAETTTPVWEIPYPAVTFCFETKSRQTIFNFTKYFHLYNNNTGAPHSNITEDEVEMFEDLCLVCDAAWCPKDGRKVSNGTVTVENIKSVAPNLTEMFYGCKWQNTLYQNCSSMFSPILTEEGLCYTFNMLRAEDLFRVENLHTEYPYLEFNPDVLMSPNLTWSLGSGFEPDAPMETYPLRGSGFGAKSGIAFVMKTKEIDQDFLCKGLVQGFKILLHNPAELPRLSQQFFRSPLSKEIVVSIKPKMMTTSEGLRAYSPERRQCYFPNERYLRYFKVYTQFNCEMECLANFTNTMCGCVHFGMPHSADIPVCNAGSIECVTRAQVELSVNDIKEGLHLEEAEGNDTLPAARQRATQCHCLPACNSIEYDAEMSQADYDWRAIYQAYDYPVPEEEKDMLCARVSVYFKEPQFMTSRRSELFGPTDFLANCGGLLGLFMGFSILSVVEIVYFFSLRILCAIWRRRKEVPHADEVVLNKHVQLQVD